MSINTLRQQNQEGSTYRKQPHSLSCVPEGGRTLPTEGPTVCSRFFRTLSSLFLAFWDSGSRTIEIGKQLRRGVDCGDVRTRLTAKGIEVASSILRRRSTSSSAACTQVIGQVGLQGVACSWSFFRTFRAEGLSEIRQKSGWLPCFEAQLCASWKKRSHSSRAVVHHINARICMQYLQLPALKGEPVKETARAWAAAGAKLWGFLWGLGIRRSHSDVQGKVGCGTAA